MNKFLILGCWLAGLLLLPGYMNGQGQFQPTLASNVIPSKAIFINAVEAEIQIGRGGGAYGFMLKANDWRRKFRSGFFYWGASISSFWGSENWDAPPALIEGNLHDTHLRLHIGTSFSNIFHSPISIDMELFGGGFHAFSKGTYTQTNLGFSRDFRNSEWVWDGGGRFAIRYALKDGWGIQASVASSWKQAGFGLGVAAGLFGSETDGKTAIGIGVNKSFGWSKPFYRANSYLEEL